MVVFKSRLKVKSKALAQILAGNAVGIGGGQFQHKTGGFWLGRLSTKGIEELERLLQKKTLTARTRETLTKLSHYIRDGYTD